MISSLGRGEGTFDFAVLVPPRTFLVDPFFFVWWSPPLLGSPWKMKIPKKVKFFIWQINHGRINTLGKLLRKLSFLVGPFYFILCRRAEEDLYHLFWICY